MSDERRLIVESMERVRVKRVERMADLGHEVQRLTDWREHVRAAPLAAITASVLTGMVCVSKLLMRPKGTQGRTNASSLLHPDPAPGIGRHSVFENALGTATTLAMPLLANAFQKQLTAVLQSLTSTRSEKRDEQPNESI